VGGIDEHTFDAKLFLGVAEAAPDLTFVLVGDCSLPAEWCTLPNVVQLGRKDYGDVADYMAACDVLIMPWRQNDWIRACNPVKLKEYLAVGRPIVSTPFEELRRYDGLVQVATRAESFGATIRRALEEPGDTAQRRGRIAAETWSAKGRAVAAYLREADLVGAYIDDTEALG
jgi:glycosyltransferase involved in cell wall biosynthesis